jgi:ubiquitin carboxyl-terminal hydrolase 34
MLQDLFRGTSINQQTCKSCGFTSFSNEHFYNLSVEVKNKTSLQQSLFKMLEFSEINDYKCSNCLQTVDLLKRSVIGETPNVLFVHLQRILLNYDTFESEKINSKFDFPTILDLRPYSLKPNL